MPLLAKTVLTFIVVVTVVAAIAWTIRRLRANGSETAERPKLRRPGVTDLALIIGALYASLKLVVLLSPQNPLLALLAAFAAVCVTATFGTWLLRSRPDDTVR